MLPQQHRQESLHRAYIAAIAAQAGIKVEFSSGVEYGVDGTFRLVGEFVSVDGARSFREMGYPLDFQMKSTVGCRELKSDATRLSFDCDISAYNKIAAQNSSDTVPVLLLVLCLPVDEREWVSAAEEALMLRNGCYWYFLRGPQILSKRSQTIRVPRGQLFTPIALTDIINRVQAKDGNL